MKRCLRIIIALVMFSFAAWNCEADPIDPPSPSSNTPICEGSGTTLLLFTNPPPGGPYTYLWSGPMGFSSFQENPIIVNPLTTNSGLYSVTISDGIAQAIGNTNVNINETPNQPFITAATNGICEGEALQLSTLSYPGTNVVYEWTGPGGMIPGNNSPTFEINPAVIGDAGDYTVQVTVDGCTSMVSPLFVLDVSRVPVAPVPSNNGPICDKETLQLFANSLGFTTYYWTGPNGFVSYDQNPILSTASLSNAGVYVLTISTTGGCTNSGVTNIEINPIPDQPELTANTNSVCLGEDITFTASAYQGNSIIYEWVNPSGAVIPGAISETLNINSITFADAGNYTVQVTVDGCFSIVSDNFELLISNPGDIADAGMDIIQCGGSEVTLSAIPPGTTGVSGTWTQSPAQTAAGVIIQNPSDANTIVSNLMQGDSYNFTWTLSEAGCGDFDVDFVAVTLDVAPTELANAGPDNINCDNNSYTLTANTPASGSGMWTSVSLSAIIANPNFSTTQVSDLAVGVNTFYWTLSNGQCNDYSVDSVTIFVEQFPNAVTDMVTTVKDVVLSGFDVLSNDDLSGFINDSWSINVVEEPDNGTLINYDDGTFDYTPHSDFYGNDQFSYEICSENCVTLCASAIVEIQVNGEMDCLPPTVFTPNNDGTNDNFVINCLGFYPNSKMTIFNRWGDQVFIEQPYQNNWDGSYSGGDLPIGTYYYILELNDATSETIQGYIMLNR